MKMYKGNSSRSLMYNDLPGPVMESVVLHTDIKTWSSSSNTPFSLQLTNQPNKLDHSITQLETLTSDKHSTLLGQFLSYKENEVLWIRTINRNNYSLYVGKW